MIDTLNCIYFVVSSNTAVFYGVRLYRIFDVKNLRKMETGYSFARVFYRIMESQGESVLLYE